MLIIVGAALAAMRLAGDDAEKLRQYRHLQQDLSHIRRETEFHLTPLPLLLSQLSQRRENPLAAFYRACYADLETAQNVADGIRIAAAESKTLFPEVAKLMTEVFSEFGQDLASQLRAIDLGLAAAEEKIQSLRQSMQTNRKNYRIFCLCAGLAVAIILV